MVLQKKVLILLKCEGYLDERTLFFSAQSPTPSVGLLVEGRKTHSEQFLLQRTQDDFQAQYLEGKIAAAGLLHLAVGVV